MRDIFVLRPRLLLASEGAGGTLQAAAARAQCRPSRAPVW